MEKTSETVVFFGSGPVAAQSLELLNQSFTVEAVITKPRPAHHKGAVPVLEMAKRLDLTVYTAEDKSSLDVLFENKLFKSRVGVLIDFGILVSQKVIDYFPLGIVNSHFSMLPQWRGADPITFAILSGQKETGVTLMLLVAAMDEGPILGQRRHRITKDTTTPELTKALIELNYKLLRDTLPKYLSKQVKPRPQDDIPATYSRRLSKQDGIIDWTKPAQQLEREVRAFVGWPQSKTTLGGKEVIITQAKVVGTIAKPGQITVNGQRLVVGTGQDSLEIIGLKPAGKAVMNAAAFLAGYKRFLQQEN